MAGDRTSAGDPSRALALLWRQAAPPKRTRGPRRTLSVDEIVRASVSIADVEGLESVTMRRVAHELSAAPMTLYTYVPTKAELLDLMVDSVYEQMPHVDRHGEPWRSRIEGIARENRKLFDLHPWCATVSTVRPPLGPGLMAKYERELQALDGIGLDDVEMDAALTHLLSFVRSAALADAAARAAVRESGMSDEQWWNANAPYLSRALDENKYPTATRVGSAYGAAHRTAFSANYAFAFGLERVIDGLGALIDSRSA